MKAREAQTLRIPIGTEPGSLAEIYRAFKKEGINILSSWAYHMGPTQAQAHFYPADLEKTKAVLAKMKIDYAVEKVIYVEGDDKIGAYLEVLEKASEAGVNIEASDCLAIGGKFASVLFAEEDVIARLKQSLGLK